MRRLSKYKTSLAISPASPLHFIYICVNIMAMGVDADLHAQRPMGADADASISDIGIGIGLHVPSRKLHGLGVEGECREEATTAGKTGCKQPPKGSIVPTLLKRIWVLLDKKDAVVKVNILERKK